MPLPTNSGLVLLSLVTGLVGIGTAPSQAVGESWVVKSVNAVGCASNDWNLTTMFSGMDGGDYTAHTVVTAGGLTYMNEDATFAPTSGADAEWGLYEDSSYGPTTASYPIPAGQPMTVTFTLEKPKGTELSSWSVVAQSCDRNIILFNAADLDRDLVADADDACPHLAESRTDGCPLRDRTLLLKRKYDPRRVIGRLDAAGYPALSAGRAVQIWKNKPGPDRLIASRTTNDFGKFKARVGKGRYYATSPDSIAARSGEALADTSNRVRAR